MGLLINPNDQGSAPIAQSRCLSACALLYRARNSFVPRINRSGQYIRCGRRIHGRGTSPAHIQPDPFPARIAIREGRVTTCPFERDTSIHCRICRKRLQIITGNSGWIGYHKYFLWLCARSECAKKSDICSTRRVHAAQVYCQSCCGRRRMAAALPRPKGQGNRLNCHRAHGIDLRRGEGMDPGTVHLSFPRTP